MHAASAFLAAYATDGVGAIPPFRTVAPAASTPALNAAVRRGPVVRVSRPIITWLVFEPTAFPTCNARPIRLLSYLRRIPEEPNSIPDWFNLQRFEGSLSRMDRNAHRGEYSQFQL